MVILFHIYSEKRKNTSSYGGLAIIHNFEMSTILLKKRFSTGQDLVILLVAKEEERMSALLHSPVNT